MTPIQKLETAIVRLEGATMLSARENAVDALHRVAELARELTADAEMSRIAMQNELEVMAQRLARLERALCSKSS